MTVKRRVWSGADTKASWSGRSTRRKKAVLEAFAARFDAVPAAVRDTVAQASDLERLSQWLRVVVRAQDADGAAAAVLETH